MGDDAFDAFISYSHSSDSRLAVALRDGLQQFAKPWNRRRAMRVFLDRSSLELSSDLAESLQAKLGGARSLILLASQESAASKWCDAEAQFWVRHKGADTLLVVLTDADGSITWDPVNGVFDPARSSALPPSLHTAFEREPIWLDMTWVERDGEAAELDLRGGPFRDAVATLASSITGIPKDELDGEDVRQHRRFQRVRRVAIGALVLLTIGALTASVLAIRSQREADRNAAEAKRQEAIAVANADEAQRQEAIAVANADESRSRELAARALNVVATDPEQAVLLAIEAMHPDAAGVAPPTQDAEEALGISLRAFVGGGEAVVERIVTPATAMAVSPDGRTIATGSSTSPTLLWDVRTGQQRPELAAPPFDAPFPDLLRFNTDGSWISSVGGPDEILSFVAWDIDEGIETGNGISREGARSVAYSVDGESVFGAIGGMLFRTPLRGAPDEDFGARLNFDRYIELPEATIREVVTLADGSLLIVDSTGRAQLHLDGQVVAGVGWDGVLGVAASADGRSVVIERDGASEHTLEVWQVGDAGAEPVSTIPVARWRPLSDTSARLALRGTDTIAILGATPAGDQVSEDTAVVIDVATGAEVDRFSTFDGTIISWLADEGTLVIGSPSEVRFEVITAITGYEPFVGADGFGAGADARSNDGLMSAVVGNGSVTIESASGTVVTPGVAPVRFDAAGERLAVAGSDGTVGVVDATSGDALWSGSAPDAVAECGPAISAIGWAPDGRSVAVAYTEPFGATCVAVLDVATCGGGTSCVTFEVAGRPGAAATAATPIDGGVIVGYDTGVIARFDTAGRTRLPSPHRNAVHSIAFSPDGVLMATADGSVAIWNVATTSVIQTSDDIRALAHAYIDHVTFDEDRRAIMTGSWSTHAVWPDVDVDLACELVSDAALSTFASAEAERSDDAEFVPACARLGLR